MDSFLYFGFGSNLLARRLWKSCPSAKLLGAARLDGHRLSFWNLKSGPSRRWLGATATLTVTPGDHVWGAVWRIDSSEAARLDEQEGIARGIYRHFPVSPTWPDGSPVGECVCYAMIEHTPAGQVDGVPSPHYLKVIRAGALEAGLPEEYRRRLAAIQDNGNVERCAALDDLFPGSSSCSA